MSSTTGGAVAFEARNVPWTINLSVEATWMSAGKARRPEKGVLETYTGSWLASPSSAFNLDVVGNPIQLVVEG